MQSSGDALDVRNDFEQERRLDVERRPLGYSTEQTQHILGAALAAAYRAQEDTQGSVNGQLHFAGGKAGCRVVRQEQVGAMLIRDL